MGVETIRSHPSTFNMAVSDLMISFSENIFYDKYEMSCAVGPFESFSQNFALKKIHVNAIS